MGDFGQQRTDMNENNLQDVQPKRSRVLIIVISVFIFLVVFALVLFFIFSDNEEISVGVDQESQENLDDTIQGVVGKKDGIILDLCARQLDNVKRNSCIYAQAIQEKDQEVCGRIDDKSFYRDACFGALARENGDEGICSRINDYSVKGRCERLTESGFKSENLVNLSRRVSISQNISVFNQNTFAFEYAFPPNSSFPDNIYGDSMLSVYLDDILISRYYNQFIPSGLTLHKTRIIPLRIDASNTIFDLQGEFNLLITVDPLSGNKSKALADNIHIRYYNVEGPYLDKQIIIDECEIEDVYNQQRDNCYMDKAREFLDPRICQSLEIWDTNGCYKEFANSQNNYSFCNYVSEIYKINCISEIAIETRDPSGCDIIKDDYQKDYCLAVYSLYTGDTDICKRVENTLLKEGCEDKNASLVGY